MDVILEGLLVMILTVAAVATATLALVIVWSALEWLVDYLRESRR